jgi:hypothetical protein
VPAQDAEPSPIPTQTISNGEFMPAPQGELQKKLAVRLVERADIEAKRHGIARRGFLRTASGMAAAFLVMNDVYALYHHHPADVVQGGGQHLATGSAIECENGVGD